MVQIEMEPSPVSHGELVERARQGDTDARDALARVARTASYVFAVQLCRDPDRAHDIAQDSVMRFLGSLDRFDPARPVEPWLFQIVRNRVRDSVRRERVPATEPLDLASGEERREVRDEGADPLGVIVRTELQRGIWDQMAGLSPAHREIIVLRDHHGLAYKEIAATLAIPVGTVMSRLHAARTDLRARLVAAGIHPKGEPT